jgi:hypothetical protein
MSKRIRLTLVLTALFIVAALFLGTAAPQQANAPVKSPYVSALSNYSVGTAVAASAKCTNTGCLVLQGIQSCRGGEFPGTNCVLVSGSCSVTNCGGH